MTTLYRFMLLFVLLLPGLLRAEELFKGATVVNLPFPPDSRKVIRMVVFNGDLIAVVRMADNSPAFFRPGDNASVTDELPIGGKLPEVLVNPDLPLLPMIDRQSAFTILDNGKLAELGIFGQINEIGQVAGTRPFELKGFQISRAIVQGPDGALYTTGANGAIFKYDPAANKLEKLNASLPAVKGREPWASLDAGVFGPDGLLYGGTFDGYLFTFDPKTNAVVNLGKPFRQQRIRGLAFRGGKLIGIGGDDDGMPRSFAFDPQARGFELGGGIPDPNGNFPLMEPIGAMLGLPDGTIYFSTTGRLANLYMWKP
ncbi:MAG: NHL repeat-containing protein [Armatimonadota bacterium]